MDEIQNVASINGETIRGGQVAPSFRIAFQIFAKQLDENHIFNAL